MTDLEGHRLERLRTDRMSAPRRVALEPEIETEEPHVRHASHGTGAVKVRALFRDLMPHVGKHRRHALDRFRDLRVDRDTHERR